MPAHTNPILAQAQKVNSTVADPTSTASTVSTKVTEVTPIDSPLAVTFEDAMKAQTKGMQEQAAITEKQIAGQAEQGTLLSEVAHTVEAAAQNTVLIDRVKATSQLEADLDAKRVFKALGGPDELVRLSKEIRVAKADKEAKLKAVQENVDVDFSTDPTQWFVNKFTIGAMDEEYNVASARVRDLERNMKSITSLASSAEQALENLKVTETTGTIAAQAKLTAQEASIKAAGFELESQKTGAKQLELLKSMSKADVAAAVDGYKLGLIARSEEARLIDRAARDSKTKTADELLETWVDKTLIGLKAAGAKLYTGADPALIEEQRNTLKAGLKSGGKELKLKYDRAFNIGTGMERPTPFESYKSAVIYRSPGLIEGTNPALVSLDGIYQEILAENPEADATSVGKVTDARTVARFKMYDEEIKSGDTTNPNRAAPLSAIIKLPSVAGEPIVQSLLSDILSEEIIDLPPEKVLEYAIADIKTKANPEGQFTVDDVTEGFAAIYGSAVTQNNMLQERERLGLPLQKKYMAKLGNIYSDKLLGFDALPRRVYEAVDLTDKVAVKAAIVQLLSSKYRKPTFLDYSGVSTSTGDNN